MGICAGLMLFFGGAFAAHAQIAVTFEQTPLFSNANLLPGDSVTRSADVTNSYENSRGVYVETLREENSGGLGDVITLTITDEKNTAVYTDTFTNFIAGGRQPLGTLDPGSTKMYSFTAAFANSAGNAHQNATLHFDLCIGLDGGNFTCDDNTTTTVTPPGGGGGGGGGNTRALLIFNEDDEIKPPTSADITWETNLDASSKVFYGRKDQGPYDLDPNQQNYGYPFATTEVFNDTENHLVTLPGLETNVTYVYRVASRKNVTDPLTVSPEYEFIILRSLTPAPTENLPPQPPGIVAGVTDVHEEESEQKPPEEKPTIPPQVAGAFSGVPEALQEGAGCYLNVLLILLAIYIAWVFWDTIRDYKNTLTKYQRNVRRIQFLIAGVVAALGVVIVLGYICAIIPLLIALTVLVVLLLIILIRGDRENRPPETTFS